MKKIRNIEKAWKRYGELLLAIKSAVKKHRPRASLYAELNAVMTSILDYERRHSHARN